MSSSQLKLLSTILVAFSFAAHPACADAMVLCISSDGHVEIEASVNGSCGEEDATMPDAAPASRVVLTGAESASHCGQCVDIPIIHASDDDMLFVPSQFKMSEIAPDLLAVAASAQPVLNVFPPKIESESSTSTFCRSSLRSISLQV